MRQALGLLEVIGLASAVSAADVMTKSAAVELLGVEKAKGSGWMTVKVTGDVGAVKASVESGEASSRQDGSFVSAKVIPRPAEGLEKFFYANDYGMSVQEKPAEIKPAEVQLKAEVKPVEARQEEVKAEPEKMEAVSEVKEEIKTATPPQAQQQAKNQTDLPKGEASNKKQPPPRGGKK